MRIMSTEPFDRGIAVDIGILLRIISAHNRNPAGKTGTVYESESCSQIHSIEVSVKIAKYNSPPLMIGQKTKILLDEI